MQDIQEEMDYGMEEARIPREIPQFDEEEYDDEEEDQMDAPVDANAALDYEGFEKIINTEGNTNN